MTKPGGAPEATERQAKYDDPDPPGVGRSIMLIPLLVAPVVVFLGLGLLLWQIITDPSNLPSAIWVVVASAILYATLAVCGKYSRGGAPLHRVLNSTDNSPFYKVGANVAMLVIIIGMLMRASAIFFAGLAIVLGTLTIDIVVRLSIEYARDKRKRRDPR